MKQGLNQASFVHFTSDILPQTWQFVPGNLCLSPWWSRITVGLVWGGRDIGQISLKTWFCCYSFGNGIPYAIPPKITYIVENISKWWRHNKFWLSASGCPTWMNLREKKIAANLLDTHITSEIQNHFMGWLIFNDISAEKNSFNNKQFCYIWYI